MSLKYSPDEVGRVLVFHGYGFRRFLCEAFAEKLYTFNASTSDLNAIQARQRRAERASKEYREAVVARVTYPDPVERHFAEAEKTKAAQERIEAKESRVRILSEMEQATREIAKPKRSERRLKVWDDELEESA